MRGLQTQVILNKLDAKPWEVLKISDLGDIKGAGDEDSFLMNWWEGTYSRVFDAQLFETISKEFHLLEEIVAFMSINVAFVMVLEKKALIEKINFGDTQ